MDSYIVDTSLTHYSSFMKRQLSAFLFILLASLFAQAEDAAPLEEGREVYRLQRNDSISVTMFQEAAMSRSALIGKSGSISFPLIGSVDLVGLTVPELEQKLVDLYKKDYFVDPKISVIITSYATKSVIVSGGVTRPGAVPYPDEGIITLAQAIAASGGITEMGDTNRITIVRKKGGSTVTTMNQAGELELLPGDTALVHMLPMNQIILHRYDIGRGESPRRNSTARVGQARYLVSDCQSGWI